MDSLTLTLETSLRGLESFSNALLWSVILRVSDPFTDSSSTTLSDSNCSANSLCFAFLTALNKTWDSLLHVTANAAAKTGLTQLCFGSDFHVPQSPPNPLFYFYMSKKIVHNAYCFYSTSKESPPRDRMPEVVLWEGSLAATNCSFKEIGKGL